MFRNKIKLILAGICIVMAFGVFYIGTTKLSAPADKVQVVRLTTNVSENSVITSDMIQSLYVSADAVTSNMVTDVADVVGKYAKNDLYTYDFINVNDVTDNANTFDNYVLDLPDNHYAFALDTNTLQSSVAAKVRKGDIVTIISYNKEDDETKWFESLQYVKVIGVTNSLGNEAKEGKYEDNDELPVNIIIECDALQLDEANRAQNYGFVSFAIVARANSDDSNRLLEYQESLNKKTMGIYDEVTSVEDGE